MLDGLVAVPAAARKPRSLAHHSTPTIYSSASPFAPLPLTAVKHCVKLRESGRYRREAGAALLAGADLVLELAPYCAPYRALVALDGDQLPAGDAWPATHAPRLLQLMLGALLYVLRNPPLPAPLPQRLFA